MPSVMQFQRRKLKKWSGCDLWQQSPVTMIAVFLDRLSISGGSNNDIGG